MTSPATRDDLKKRSLRPLTPIELDWAAIRLTDAFNQIAVQLPAVPSRLSGAAPGSTFEQLVVQVQVAMVLRVLANPDYVRQQSIDDSTTILDQAVSSGELYVSPNEQAMLTAGDGGSDGAWTIRARPAPGPYASNPAAAFTGTMSNVL